MAELDVGAPAPCPLARRWRRAIAALADPALRTAYMRSELAVVSPAEAAEALDEVFTAAAGQADLAASDVVTAVVPTLADALLARGGPTGAAARQGRHPNAPPFPASNAAPVLTAAGGRQLTLGERKALARRPSRVALDALMRDPHPMVLRALLATPRLTEDDVVRMAARRPGSPVALTEIARAPRWMVRYRVRLALVLNPTTPPAIALPLVSLLRQPELERLTLTTDVPALLRRAAREVAETRALATTHPGPSAG